MNSKERVLCTIEHVQPDRVPLNIWMFRDDVSKKVCERYGSMESFYDRYGIDVHMTITPPPCITNMDYLEEKMIMEPEDIKSEHWLDPDDPVIYKETERLIGQYGKNKAIFVHVWGVVEAIYGFCGIERTLMLMSSEPEFAKELFSKVEDFSRKVVKNLLGMGIDVLHITGDVGSNNNMLFSPNMWRELVAPFDQRIIEPAIKSKIPVSLHSCGYCMPIIEDWLNMGISIIHPVQESAGMDPIAFKKQYGDRLTMHGGLDLRHLSVMKPEEVESYISTRMEVLKKGGGYIFNTSHTVQMDVSLDILEKAYDFAKEYGKYEIK